MEAILKTRCIECKGEIPLEPLSKLANLACPHCNQAMIKVPNVAKTSLIVVYGENPGTAIPIDDEVSFGRAPSNTVTLREMKASRQHAIVKKNGSQYILKDLRSANGTYVNDQLISSRVLATGDLLRIADSIYLYRNPKERVSVTSKLGARFKDADYETQFEVQYAENREMLTLSGSTQDLDVGTLQKAHDKLRIIYDVTSYISSILDLEVLLERILDVVFEHIPAERGAIFLVGEDGQLEQRVVKKRGEEVEDRYLEISNTILSKVVNERKSLLSSDTQQDESFSHAHSIISQGIRQMMSVPLICRDELLGLLHIDTTRMSKAFDHDNLQLLTGIAGQAAIAIQNARLLARIEEETRTRAALSRYLAPELVDQVVNKQLDLGMGGQVKKATVLFSDIRGFTPMSERIQPVDVVETLNRYFEVMVDIIFKHGGMLDKFIGDAIMAIWGLPLGRPLDSLRAVRAAIEMQVQLFLLNYKLRREGREEIFMGVGINTGDVVSGNMGSTKRSEYTVIGSTVNLAARIESLTRKQQVLISENTYREVRPYVRAIELAPTTVKGIQGEIKVYRVLGVVPEEDETTPDATASERRSAPRLDAFFPVQVRSDNGAALDGVIVNVSSTGLAVEVLVHQNLGFDAGSRWSVSLDVPGLDGLPPATAQVQRCQTVYQEGTEDLLKVGLSFQEIPPAFQQFLNEVLFRPAQEVKA